MNENTERYARPRKFQGSNKLGGGNRGRGGGGGRFRGRGGRGGGHRRDEGSNEREMEPESQGFEQGGDEGSPRPEFADRREREFGVRVWQMAWTTPVDRAVLRELDHIRPGSNAKEMATELLQSLLRLNPTRRESFFSLGYADRTHGVVLDAYKPGELETELAHWHRFGQAMASMRRRQGDVAEKPDLQPLMESQEIAQHLLPILLRQSLREGKLEATVQTLESVLAAGTPGEATAELLRSTLSEILHRAERPRENMDTAAVLDLLRRCTMLPGFGHLAAEIRAPFHRSIGKLRQHLKEFDEAAEQYRLALQIAGEGQTLASVLHFDLAACMLHIRGVPDLEPVGNRGDVAVAMSHLDLATADAQRASFNAFFARGILRFEQGKFTEASMDFRAALERLEHYRNPLPVTLARIRYFLGLTLLRAGHEEDREEAVRHLELALDRLRLDIEVLEEIVPLLRDHNPKVALRALSKIDVNSATDPQLILAVASLHQLLGDAEGALKLTSMALERTEEMDLRKDALLIELRSFNMMGERENARDAIYDLRDLCYQSDDFKLWEDVITDSDRVGQALDRGRILSEQAELLGHVPGRESDRHGLVRQIARRYLDRAESHWRIAGLQLLKDVARHEPKVFERDVRETEASIGVEVPRFDRSTGLKAREVLKRAPSILVIGGDEHQDRREDDLDAIAAEWGAEADWWQTDYVNPDRVLDRLRDHLTARQPDGILLLHWNREEVIREARKHARTYRVPTRFIHYVGMESLRQGIGDLLVAASSARYEDTEPSSGEG